MCNLEFSERDGARYRDYHFENEFGGCSTLQEPSQITRPINHPITKKTPDLSNRAYFLRIQQNQPKQIWAPEISEKVKNSLRMYTNHTVLKNGKTYGDSVRYLDLSEKTAGEINSELNQKDCESRNDFIRKGGTGAPVRNQKGQTLPMITWICKDGGVVRIKPKGDSSSHFRPQPHASKALRYPFDSPYETFEDETLKIDNLGNPIPKWTKDLNQVFEDPQDQAKFVQGWADDAHTDLVE